MPPNPPPPPPNGPPGPRPPPPPPPPPRPPPPPPAPAAPCATLPKPKVLLSLTFRTKRPALVKKLTGISSPGAGTVLNAGNPGTVTTFCAGVAVVANVGR